MISDTCLVTPRLELIPSTVTMLQAELARNGRLGSLLNAVVPKDWPPADLAEVLPYLAGVLQRHPEYDRWWIYYWLTRPEKGSSRLLIGSGGFKGKPDKSGVVEIGYGLSPSFWGRGFATEAAGRLLEFAFAEPSVVQVIANAGHENKASLRVLEKLSFEIVGPGSSPEMHRLALTRRKYEERT